MTSSRDKPRRCFRRSWRHYSINHRDASDARDVITRQTSITSDRLQVVLWLYLTLDVLQCCIVGGWYTNTVEFGIVRVSLTWYNWTGEGKPDHLFTKNIHEDVLYCLWRLTTPCENCRQTSIWAHDIKIVYSRDLFPVGLHVSLKRIFTIFMRSLWKQTRNTGRIL